MLPQISSSRTWRLSAQHCCGDALVLADVELEDLEAVLALEAAGDLARQQREERAVEVDDPALGVDDEVAVDDRVRHPLELGQELLERRGAVVHRGRMVAVPRGWHNLRRDGQARWAEHLGQDDPDHDAADRRHGRRVRRAQRHQHPPRVRRLGARSRSTCSSAAARPLGELGTPLFARAVEPLLIDHGRDDRDRSRSSQTRSRRTPRTARTARRTTASSSPTCSTSTRRSSRTASRAPSSTASRRPSNHEPVGAALGQLTVDTWKKALATWKAERRGKGDALIKFELRAGGATLPRVRVSRCSSARRRPPPARSPAEPPPRARATSCSATTSRRSSGSRQAADEQKADGVDARPRSTPARSVRCSR